MVGTWVCACAPAVNDVCILSIWYQPICSSSESNHLPFSLIAQPHSLLLRVFWSPEGLHRELLPGYLQTQHVLSFPPRTTYFPLHAVLDTNRKEKRKQRTHFLYVQPAFYTMEQEAPGNCKECEGKIKCSLYPIDCSFFACSSSRFIFHHFFLFALGGH